MENLLAMPVRPIEVMLAKITPYIGIGYLQVLIILVVSAVLFGLPLNGSVLLLLAALGMFIASNLALGITFSTVAANQILQDGVATRAHHIAGWLPVTAMAKRLGVSSSWIKRRIRSGTINIQRDPWDKRFLFPDTEASIVALRELKTGARDHLVFDPRANK